MEKKLMILIIGIFVFSLSFSLINAEGLTKVCIDKDAPTWGLDSSLNLEAVNDNDVKVEWTPAKDKPNCSGIDYYTVFRGKNNGDLSFIGNSTNTSFLDKGLDYGTYSYMIHAFDKVGHNESNVSISLTLEKPSDGGNDVETSSGGGGSFTSTTSVWECGEWSECINGTQTRVCEDLKGYDDNKTETKDCSLDFTSLGDENEEDLSENQTNESNSENISEESSRTGLGITGFATNLANTVLGEDNQGKTLSYLTIIVVALAIVVMFVKRVRNEGSTNKKPKKSKE